MLLIRGRHVWANSAILEVQSDHGLHWFAIPSESVGARTQNNLFEFYVAYSISSGVQKLKIYHKVPIF